MVKISVIIPVYNVKNYLKRCLESVCNQTLKEIEIICIDNFSSDGSAEILEEYVKIYPNLTVRTLEKNHGVSVARNVGLSLAQGEYLAFVDSDDEVDLNFYEKLYEIAKERDADLVRGQATEIAYDGKRTVVKQIPEGSKWHFLSYWVLAIYRRSLIGDNNISFSTNHSLGEDLLFLNQAVTAAKNLQLVEGVYYYYHRREDSADSKILSEEKIKSALDVYEAIVDNINSNVSTNDSIYNLIFYHFIMSCFYLSLKSEDKKAKQLCARKTADIFEKCQDRDGLEKLFAKTAPHLFMLLKNQDAEEVENLLIKCKSRMEIIASGLRARIKNNYE